MSSEYSSLGTPSAAPLFPCYSPQPCPQRAWLPSGMRVMNVAAPKLNTSDPQSHGAKNNFPATPLLPGTRGQTSWRRHCLQPLKLPRPRRTSAPLKLEGEHFRLRVKALGCRPIAGGRRKPVAKRTGPNAWHMLKSLASLARQPFLHTGLANATTGTSIRKRDVTKSTAHNLFAHGRQHALHQRAAAAPLHFSMHDPYDPHIPHLQPHNSIQGLGLYQGGFSKVISCYIRIMKGFN